MFLWKSSGSGRRRRPGGLLRPPRPRLELLHLGLKVKEVDSEVPGLRGAICSWSGEAGLALGRARPALWNVHQVFPALRPFPDSDDALLKMTISQQEFGRAGLPDLSSMTEEEQIAYAMQMSLQGAGEPGLRGRALAEVVVRRRR